MSRLKNTVNDALLMAGVLKSVGFIEIGGCCDRATGKWQYGGGGCAGTMQAFHQCISRRH